MWTIDSINTIEMRKDTKKYKRVQKGTVLFCTVFQKNDTKQNRPLLYPFVLLYDKDADAGLIAAGDYLHLEGSGGLGALTQQRELCGNGGLGVGCG